MVIGPGGKKIKKIQEETGAQIDIEDDGTVNISCTDAAGAERAKEQVEWLVAEVEIGKIYEGKVVSIKDFGAFVEVLPGQEGLCHVSELSDGYVNSVTDVVKIGDTLRVKVILKDDQGRIKLSARAALAEDRGETYKPPERSGRSGGGDRGPRRSAAADAIAVTAAAVVIAAGSTAADRGDRRASNGGGDREGGDRDSGGGGGDREGGDRDSGGGDRGGDRGPDRGDDRGGDRGFVERTRRPGRAAAARIAAAIAARGARAAAVADSHARAAAAAATAVAGAVATAAIGGTDLESSRSTTRRNRLAVAHLATAELESRNFPAGLSTRL